MASVKERTQKEIEDYIRQHSQDGKLTESLLDIAEKIGYSNATVHRALKALEDKGLISIEQAQRPTEPNTIIFKGDKNEIDNLLSKGVQLSNNLKVNSNDLDDFIRETHWAIRQLQEEVERLKAEKDQWSQGEVINVMQLPETNVELITIRRETPQKQEATTGA